MARIYDRCAWVWINKSGNLLSALADRIADELRNENPDSSLLDCLNQCLKHEQGRFDIKSPLVPPDGGGRKYIDGSGNLEQSGADNAVLGMFQNPKYICDASPTFIGSDCHKHANEWFKNPPDKNAEVFVAAAKTAHAHILIGYAS